MVEKNKLYRKICENRFLGKLFNRETLSYIFVGMLTTLLSFILFGAALWFFNERDLFTGTSPGLLEAVAKYPWLGYIPNLANSLGAFAAEIVSAFFALTFSFVANKHFVFESKSWAFGIVLRELTGFISSRVLSLFVEMLIVLFMVSILGANTILAKFVGTIFVVVLNYILSKAVIFKKRA